MIGRLARFAARTFFRDITLEGIRNLPEGGPVIFTPNHPNGLLDPMLLFFLDPQFRLRFVAKAPLFKIPLFGSILRSIGAIPVVRKFESDGAVDYSAFFAACLDALARGDCIVIFPEGRSLPQSYLAPLKTGPARLFLMARQKGIPVQIVPVGLNYEKGTTFRSRVHVSIAPALVIESETNSAESIRRVTETLTDALEANVIQSETHRERELMSLLERLSAGRNPGHSDFERFARMKEFERGLERLRISAADEIEDLGQLLSRYDRLAEDYGIQTGLTHSGPSHRNLPAAIFGGILAAPGWLLNFIPYHLCDFVVRLTHKDASDIATYKVIYSLFLFPITYILEGMLVYAYFGKVASILFFLLILPMSYFTLYYTEWYESRVRGMFWSTSRKRMKSQLDRLRTRILERLEKVRALLPVE